MWRPNLYGTGVGPGQVILRPIGADSSVFSLELQSRQIRRSRLPNVGLCGFLLGNLLCQVGTLMESTVDCGLGIGLNAVRNAEFRKRLHADGLRRRGAEQRKQIAACDGHLADCGF